MESISSIDPAQQNQGVTPTVPTESQDKNTGGEGDFEKLLRGIIAPNQENKVSEEELFAGLCQERIQKLKGDETAGKFKEALDRRKTELTKADGFVPFEDAAKTALKDLRDAGVLTKEETDKVYSEAFDGAQLDGNKNALYDGRGGAGDATIAVELMESALLAARTLIEKFDDGSTPASTRSVDEASNTKQGATGTAVVSGGDATSVPDSTSPQGTTVDGPNGFLFKPVSANDGNLAVLMPEILAHQVDSVVLKDLSGTVLDEGHSTGYGDTGEREKFSFSKPGGSYPRDLTVEVRLSDGSVKTYTIPDPSQRYD